MRSVIVILLALMLTGQAWAAIDTWQFKDEAQEPGLPRDHLPTALPEMPEQQHRRLKRDDCR